MRARMVLALAVVGVLLGGGPVRGVEQRIEALTPPEEQRVERIGGPDDLARVDPVDAADTQGIAPAVPPSAAQKTASTVGKVVLSVAAAGLALGAMAASLLFL